MGSKRDQTDDEDDGKKLPEFPMDPRKENDAATKGLMDPPKENDAATKGCWQKLWSRKIRFVCFLLVTVIFLILLIVILVLVVILFVTRPQSANASSTTQGKIIYVQCDDGWITYKGKCYYLSNDSTSWTSSQTYCTEHKSTLAIIENEEEYYFLKNIKGENNPWIGLSKKGKDSGWVWADGKSYSHNISQIVQVTNPGDMGDAYLASNGVTIETKEDRPKKFFCTKKLFTQPA